MHNLEQDNLARELSILGKEAHLSVAARQRVRDNLFKKIGQSDLIEAVHTKTEIPGLVMPLAAILSMLTPRKVSFGLPATAAMVLGMMLITFTTGALAQNAEPGSGIFYTVRKALENTQVAFIADPVDKATKRIDIANERIEDATTKISANPTVKPQEIAPAIAATKEAVEQAKAAVEAITNEEEGTADDLTAKLQASLELQRNELEKIADEYKDDKEVISGIAAVNEELDHLLATLPTKEEEPAQEEPAKPVTESPDQPEEETPGSDQPVLVKTNFEGVLIISGGRYAIFDVNDNKVYPFANISESNQDLVEYLGQRGVSVYGPLAETGITVRQIFIDSKLVWENLTKNNNNLPWVERSQN